MATPLKRLVVLASLIAAGCATPTTPAPPPAPPPPGHSALLRKISHASPVASWDPYLGNATSLVLTWSPGSSVTLPVTSTSYQVIGLRSGVDYLFSLCAVFSNVDACVSTNWIAP